MNDITDIIEYKNLYRKIEVLFYKELNILSAIANTSAFFFFENYKLPEDCDFTKISFRFD